VFSEINGVRHRLSGFPRHFKVTVLFLQVYCKKILFSPIFCYGRPHFLKLLRICRRSFSRTVSVKTERPA
jgi:hypothetical protein